MSKIEKYREDAGGSIYEYIEDEKAYVFIGNLNGRTLKQFKLDQDEEIYYC